MWTHARLRKETYERLKSLRDRLNVSSINEAIEFLLGNPRLKCYANRVGSLPLWYKVKICCHDAGKEYCFETSYHTYEMLKKYLPITEKR